MTCKDTPLRQQGHMEVLRWLLGKQGGYDEDESEDDGMERQVLETNAINLKKGNKNDNETHTQTDTHTDAHTGCEG